MAQTGSDKTKVQVLVVDACLSDSVHSGVSEGVGAGYDLARALEASGLYEVHVLSARDVKRKSVVATPKISALIFNCQTLGKRELVRVKNALGMAGGCPALVLANQISLFSYRHIDVLKNTLAIQKPCDVQVVVSLVNRMVVGHEVKPVVSPRFITDTPVRLLNLKSGLLVPTRMRNYSATGAFFEYKGLGFKVGDVIEVKLESAGSDLHEEAITHKAKIVWIRDGAVAAAPTSTPTNPPRGVGVQFVG